jgi:hypothetical protein
MEFKFMHLKFSFALLACVAVSPLAQHLAAQSSTVPAPSDFNGDGSPDIVWPIATLEPPAFG